MQTICAIVGVAVIVRRRIVISAATSSQCYPETTVVVDGVTENGPLGVVTREAGDADAVEAVKRNDVGFPARAADKPPSGIASGDAAVSIA